MTKSCWDTSRYFFHERKSNIPVFKKSHNCLIIVKIRKMKSINETAICDIRQKSRSSYARPNDY